MIEGYFMKGYENLCNKHKVGMGKKVKKFYKHLRKNSLSSKSTRKKFFA